MISGVFTQGGGAIRQSVERLATSAQQSAASGASDQIEEERAIPPTEETASGREALPNSRDDPEAEASIEEALADRISEARAIANRLQAETQAKAGVSLVHHVDESVGSLLDIIA